MVSVLLGVPDGDTLTLTADEQVAVANLSASGLMPPLRLLDRRGGDDGFPTARAEVCS